MNEHHCRCAGCDPAIAMRLVADPAHFSIEDPGAHLLRVYRRLPVMAIVNAETLDVRVDSYIDVDVSTSCFQVIAGEEGQAWRYSEPAHLCKRCELGPCSYVQSGHFWVERRLE